MCYKHLTKHTKQKDNVMKYFLYTYGPPFLLGFIVRALYDIVPYPTLYVVLFYILCRIQIGLEPIINNYLKENDHV